ncbi:uncharacterized protein LOC107844878 isoform X2 [Capsicum annuum]|uniref:uncharacterized protein LOC107844878 isoform X2 n=1 Tax=Capsicum annuum TaxID=4072 RepID=UPI001FB10DE4|nr:uncharacterized protein LOC107844878 isoform X2 [Capsicum annuum]
MSVFAYESPWMNIQIGNHTQPILYEEEGSLCVKCGLFDHIKDTCHYSHPQATTDKTNQESSSSKTPVLDLANPLREWQTVKFLPKHRPFGGKKTTTTPTMDKMTQSNSKTATTIVTNSNNNTV